MCPFEGKGALQSVAVGSLVASLFAGREGDETLGQFSLLVQVDQGIFVAGENKLQKCIRK